MSIIRVVYYRSLPIGFVKPRGRQFKRIVKGYEHSNIYNTVFALRY